MRIACLYLPSLPLQVFVRSAPQWIGAPVAVISAGRVVACSRAAWAAGVRPGASGPAAHELVPGLVAVPAAPEAERAALRALADALLAISDTVEVREGAIYVAVPPRLRGASFGARLLEIVEGQGMRGRVGIADDRFTAWVAASHEPRPDEGGARVVSVPRGGSAAFLAPMPLSLLAIPPEVQHVLAVVGVRTLGEFAALPPPTTAHAWDADYQALARGDGGAGLVAYVPSARIEERVMVGGAITVGAALGIVAARIAARLAGRQRAAITLRIRGDEREHVLPLPEPTADERDLADLAGHLVADHASCVEIEVAADVAADPARREAVPLAVSIIALGSGSVPVGAPPAFHLTPPDVLPMSPREPHRRTARGKIHRRRATGAAGGRPAVAAQARLLLG